MNGVLHLLLKDKFKLKVIKQKYSYNSLYVNKIE